MTRVYTLAGVQELDTEVTPLELVHGATWARASLQIATPVDDVDYFIARACEIMQIVILTNAEANGSCVVDIWRDTYGNFPPTVADTIFASGKPTISGGKSYSDTVLSGVSRNCAAGDVLRFHLQSSSTFRRVSIFLALRAT